MTLQQYLCKYVAELLEEIGKLPDRDKDSLSLDELAQLNKIRIDIATADEHVYELIEELEG